MHTYLNSRTAEAASGVTSFFIHFDTKEVSQMIDLFQILYWIVTATTNIVGVVIEIIRLIGERRRRRRNEKTGS